MEEILVPVIVYDCLQDQESLFGRHQRRLVGAFLETLMIKLERFKLLNGVYGEWETNIIF